MRRALGAREQPGVVVGLVLLVSIAAGLLGREFGGHWDEWRLLHSARASIERFDPLPHWYNYPSFAHDVAVLAYVPIGVGAAVAGQSDAAREFLHGIGYLGYLRAMFVVLSLSAIAAVYLAARGTATSRWEAVLGAVILAGSFELHYHSRWVAPDALMTAVVAWCLVAAVPAVAGVGGVEMVAIAGVLAGAAMSTKYPAVLLTPLLVVLLPDRAGAWRARGLPLGPRTGVVAFAFLAFIALTPGAVGEPSVFAGDIEYERRHYADGHFGYSVAPGAAHARAMLDYLALNGLSPYSILAVILFALAMFGASQIRDRPVALLLLGFPVLYVGFFAFQRAMIVRNLLVILPFLAILAARGLGALVECVAGPRRSPRTIAAITAALAVIHLTFEVRAAMSVGRPLETFVRDFVADAERRPESVTMSPALAGIVGRPVDAFAKGRDRATAPAPEYVALLQNEVVYDDRLRWPANRPGFYRVFGPREVNFDYYPTWRGPDRVLVVRREHAPALLDPP